jgi:hypothetical protein
VLLVREIRGVNFKAELSHIVEHITRQIGAYFDLTLLPSSLFQITLHYKKQRGSPDSAVNIIFLLVSNLRLQTLYGDEIKGNETGGNSEGNRTLR